MSQQPSFDNGGASRSATDIGGQIREKATEQFDKMAGKVEDAAKAVTEQGREVTDQVQVVAGNFKSAVDTSLRDQPLTTLALAACAGFILGALWKS